MTRTILNTQPLSWSRPAISDRAIAIVVTPVCDICRTIHSVYGWWPMDDGGQWCDVCWHVARGGSRNETQDVPNMDPMPHPPGTA